MLFPSSVHPLFKNCSAWLPHIFRSCKITSHCDSLHIFSFEFLQLFYLSPLISSWASFLLFLYIFFTGQLILNVSVCTVYKLQYTTTHLDVLRWPYTFDKCLLNPQILVRSANYLLCMGSPYSPRMAAVRGMEDLSCQDWACLAKPTCLLWSLEK